MLLGDPQQLPQVTQGAHPDGSGASVLEHLLAARATVAADRGILLDRDLADAPRRLRFVSEPAMRTGCIRAPRARSGASTRPGRSPAPACACSRSRTRAAARRADEEAEAIAATCRELLVGGTVTDDEGVDASAAQADDIMVVAPYNRQCAASATACRPASRVGTVDSFQGQEAPVVFSR